MYEQYAFHACCSADAHAVEQEHVRLALQSREGLLEHGTFAEAQQTGNVAEPGRLASQRRLDGPEIRKRDDHHGRLGLLAPDAHVHLGDEPNRREVDRTVGDHLPPQLLLEGDGLGGGQVPAVAAVQAHDVGRLTLRSESA